MKFGFNAAEIFNIAIEIEENGRRFYEKSGTLLDDPDVKQLFEDLARQEAEHKAKFETLKAELPPEAFSPVVWDPDNKLDDYITMMANQHVFVSSDSMNARLDRIKDVSDVLKLAIEFEKDSVIFFLSMQEATFGKKGQELIGTLIKEEQTHLRRLSLQLKRLT